MPKTVRGANSERRVRLQKIHNFSLSESELDDKSEDELKEMAQDLGLYDDIEVESDLQDEPNKRELVAVLASLKNTTLT